MKYWYLPVAVAFVRLSPAAAQLVAPNDAGVTFGQINLIVKDVEAQKTFWTTMIGGKLVKNGPVEMIEFPGIYLTFTKGEPSGTAAGSVVDHFGFVFTDVPAMIAKWRANHLRVDQSGNPLQGSVHAPEDAVLLEFFQDEKMDAPVRMDHVHMFIPDIPAIQAWYAKAFGGVPGKRARVSRPGWVECDFVPGTNLSFADDRGKKVPTTGRSVDHLGFEVRNLDEFVKHLEADGIALDTPVRRIPRTMVRSAFLRDPRGTSIEVSQGLSSSAK
jgi:catechol 2,3-dioxygenase-like lactoylglutathione lyase family enzyme